MSEIQLHKVDLNLLSTFEALIEEGSVAGAADRLSLTASAVSHALGRLRTQFDDTLFVRVGGRMQATPQPLRLADEIAPVLRHLRLALKPAAPFDPRTTDRVFRIGLHSCPTLMAQVTAHLQSEAPNAMIEWVPIRSRSQADLVDGLIDLLHVGGPVHLFDRVQSKDLEPATFFSFVKRGHPAAQDWRVEMAAQYRYLQVAVEDQGAGRPVEQEHHLLNRPRTLGSKVPDFSLVGVILDATDFIATQPSIAMEDMWVRYDLEVMEPVAAPSSFPMRFTWSARNATDPANTWLRDIVIAAYDAHQADINRKFRDVLISLQR
ncbi:LysR family transcriptional regulator [Primorskyibacter sp. S187A]|uniref:LysR family transcriptional regulator n=1 Tax=Primorskyibacter sp. S187A TaxID=3415130 RepID=UPI003C7C29C2